MKKFKGFESKIMGDFEELPVGGYVCVIKAAEEVKSQNDNSSRLEIFIDIEEGEQKGYYAKLYKEDNREDKKWRGKYVVFLPRDDGSEKDSWAKNRFNNLIGCIEDANPGYHWDWEESELRGKKIALVFRREEFKKTDGSTGWTVKPFKAITVGNCKDGKWGKYEDKPLNKNASSTYSSGGFQPSFDDITDDDCPF